MPSSMISVIKVLSMTRTSTATCLGSACFAALVRLSDTT